MVDTLQEVSMVQELGYDNCTMFPSRQPGGFNMPLSFGYQQSQYGQEYGQFNVSEPAPLQQAGSPCAWTGMYPAGSPIARSGSAGLDEWSSYCPASQIGANGTQSPPAAYQHYRTNAYTTLPADYNVSNLQHLNSSGGLSNSPSPTPMGGGYALAVGPNSAATPRQTRPPYDWMKKQALPTTPSSGKTRTKDKYRVVYTDHQRLELEKEFHYSRYITIRRKAELAQSLNLSERQVKIWFQNRRAKERKQNKKRAHDDGSSAGAPPNSGANGSVAVGMGTTAMHSPMASIKSEKQVTPPSDHGHEHPYPHSHVMSPHSMDSHGLTPIHHVPPPPLPPHSQPSENIIHTQHL